MGTPCDLSKPLRTALIACICLTLIAVPVVGQTGVLIDDFEDGDLAEWNNVDQFFTITSNDADVFEGQYAAQVGDGTNTAGAYSISYAGDSYTTASNYVKIEQMDDYTEWWYGNNNVGVIHIRIDGTGDVNAVDTNTNNVDTGIDVSTGTYYRFEYSNIDYANDQYDIEVINTETSTSVGTATVEMADGGASSLDTYDTQSSFNNPIFFLDEIRIGNRLVNVYEVSGTVTDENNDALNNVSIEALNTNTGTINATDTTDAVGQYNLTLSNGTYDITASKDGYRNNTQTVTVSGSDETVDFQLTSLEASIELDTRSYLEHGTTAPYTVVVDNGTGRADVTNSSNLTVVSNDTSVVTVDTTANEIIATSDISVNNRTYITATYNDPQGTTYTATQNVTVANKTVENLKILPTGPRLSASLGANADEDPTANTIPVIIVAMILGAGVTLFARSFAGLMAATLVITLGWIGGMVGNGMIIVAVMTAIMIGLNVATNVDYSVRR